MDSTVPVDSDNRRIARAAGTVMAAFLFSSLVGVVRGMVISNAFGTSVELDAFNAANRVAELLFNLVAGGALASAFVPTLTGFLTRADRRGAWQLASAVVNLVFLILVLASSLAAFLAPQIVRNILFVLVPDFNPAQQALTVTLLRIMLPSVAVFSVSGLLMGILNAHQVFLVPAVAPAMYSLGMIFGTLALSPMLGINGLAWGVVIGSVLHLLVQLPSLFRLKGVHFYLTLGRRNRVVGEVVRLMAPRVLGVAVVQLNFIVNTIIALSLPEGSVSAVTLAFTLLLMPQMAIAQSAAIAALPTFSAQVARGRVEDMRSSLTATLRAVLVLATPASIGLILLRQPLIEILYQRGAFTTHSTELVAWALLWYAVGLVGHSLVEITSRAFYALQDTLTPVKVGVAAMGLNVVFSLAFSKWFTAIGWMPHGGLALANSTATTLEMAALLFLMRRRLHGLEGIGLRVSLLQVTISTLAMALVVSGWLWATGGLTKLVSLAGGVLIGAAVYAVAAYLLRMPEVLAMIKIVMERLKQRRL
jgi:putative peptidoglycan lipid II flippase